MALWSPSSALSLPPGSPEGPPTGYPAYHQFQPDEVVLVATRRHPVVLVGPILLVLAPWVLRAWILRQTSAPTELLDQLMIALAAVATSIGVVKIVMWVSGWFIVTQGRVLLFSGLIGQNKAVMPVQRVTDVATTRPIPRSLLGYCHVMIESAGQDQALHTVRYLAKPGRVSQVMDYVTNRPLAAGPPQSPGMPEALLEEAPEGAVPGQFLVLGILLVLGIAVAELLS